MCAFVFMVTLAYIHTYIYVIFKYLKIIVFNSLRISYSLWFLVTQQCWMWVPYGVDLKPNQMLVGYSHSSEPPCPTKEEAERV